MQNASRLHHNTFDNRNRYLKSLSNEPCPRSVGLVAAVDVVMDVVGSNGRDGILDLAVGVPVFGGRRWEEAQRNGREISKQLFDRATNEAALMQEVQAAMLRKAAQLDQEHLSVGDAMLQHHSFRHVGGRVDELVYVPNQASFFWRWLELGGRL